MSSCIYLALFTDYRAELFSFGHNFGERDDKSIDISSFKKGRKWKERRNKLNYRRNLIRFPLTSSSYRQIMHRTNLSQSFFIEKVASSPGRAWLSQGLLYERNRSTLTLIKSCDVEAWRVICSAIWGFIWCSSTFCAWMHDELILLVSADFPQNCRNLLAFLWILFVLNRTGVSRRKRRKNRE